MIQLAASKRPPVWKPYVAAVIAIVVTSAAAFAANWPFNNRRHYFIADDYVENLFSTIAPNGLLLTQDWQVASPMLYAQEIEKRRPDVKVVDINLLRRSWYFDYLQHAHPDFIDRSREKIDPYVALLKQWERSLLNFAAWHYANLVFHGCLWPRSWHWRVLPVHTNATGRPFGSLS